MSHKCIKCDYYYKTKRDKEEVRYNAISEIYENMITESKMDHACGFDAGGAFLDEEQPRCGDYKETI